MYYSPQRAAETGVEGEVGGHGPQLGKTASSLRSTKVSLRNTAGGSWQFSIK